MTNSSGNIDAALESNRLRERMIKEIQEDINKLLLDCIPYDENNMDEAMDEVQNFIRNFEEALDDIVDNESLKVISRLVAALKKNVAIEAEQKQKNKELLVSYPSLIKNFLILSGADALAIFDKGDYLNVMETMAKFLESPTQDNYDKLDKAVDNWKEMIAKVVEEKEVVIESPDEGKPQLQEKLSYLQVIKELSFGAAYIAVSCLLSTMTKATSLLSVLSYNKKMGNSQSLSVSVKTSSESIPKVSTPSDSIPKVQTPSAREQKLLDAKVNLKANFHTIFDKKNEKNDGKKNPIEPRTPKSTS